MTPADVLHAKTRADLVNGYADAIRACCAGREWIDVPAVNRAIMARWSPAALRWIKTQAWKRVQA